MEKRLIKIQKLNLDKGDKHSLTPNPLMIRALKSIFNFNDAQSIIRYLVNSTLIAGNETAYGFAIEDTIGSFPQSECFGRGKKKYGREIDVEVVRDKKHYLIQVKAGPNTINRTMAAAISRDLKEIGQEHSKPTGFATTYGTEAKISGNVKYGEFENLFVGSQFWDFLSGEENTHLEIFEIIGEAEGRFAKKYGKSLVELLNNKINELIEEFVKNYGDKDPIKSLIDLNF